MVRRQRHLGGADQVEVVGLHPVDLRGVRAEEAGALHRLRLDQRGRDHRHQPGRGRLRHRRVDQGQLQLRADPGEEVEPGAGDLGAALGVDGPVQLAELQVVAHRLRVVAHGADGLQHHRVVLAAGRHAVLDHVGQRLVRGPDRLVGGGLLGLGGPHVVGQRLGPAEQLLPLLGGRPRHLLGDRLLLAPQPVGGGHRGPAPLVRGQQRVHQRGILPAGALGGPDPVGIRPQQLEVDHADEGTGARSERCGAGRLLSGAKIVALGGPNE